jgi:hypothetical protein
MSYTVTTMQLGTSSATFTTNHSGATNVKVKEGHLFLYADKRVVAAYAPGSWLSVTQVDAGS